MRWVSVALCTPGWQVRHLFEAAGEALQRCGRDRMGVSIWCAQSYLRRICCREGIRVAPADADRST
jgi:hypothetical protein